MGRDGPHRPPSASAHTPLPTFFLPHIPWLCLEHCRYKLSGILLWVLRSPASPPRGSGPTEADEQNSNVFVLSAAEAGGGNAEGGLEAVPLEVAAAAAAEDLAQVSLGELDCVSFAEVWER